MAYGNIRRIAGGDTRTLAPVRWFARAVWIVVLLLCLAFWVGVALVVRALI